jgi:hypothetical protein
MAINYTKKPQNKPKVRKISQNNIPSGRKIDKHRRLKDPRKCTQIGIFGLKIHHLATLIR